MMKRLLIGVKSYWNSGGGRSNEFYDDGPRSVESVEGAVMNDVHDDGSRPIEKVEGVILTFTMTT